MIRQLCTHCYASVELPADAAGRDTPCPKCGKPIAVPAAYAPSVAPLGGLTDIAPPTPLPARTPISEPPPGLNPVALAPPPAVGAPAVESAPGQCSVTLSPVWLDWVPVACLAVVLVLTLFNWVGTYPGGTRVYSQNPWFASVGEIQTNTLPETLTKEEGEIDKLVPWNSWLIAYFPLLIVALVLGVLDRAVRTSTTSHLPEPLVTIWPHRFLVLTVLSGLLLTLLLIQTWRGFGLETAVKQRVAERYTEQFEKADSTAKKKEASVKMGAELASYQLQGTTPLNAAIALHAVAFLAMLGRWWLHNRGSKPHPRLSLQY